MNISKIGQPEVSGCHWSTFSSVGFVCNNNMKDGEAIVVNGGSSPIPTTFTVSMETVQDEGPLSPEHCETVSSYVSKAVAVTELLTEREREREIDRERERDR